jgi:starch-binding outer membrane protein, SusD/RagB family
MKLKTLLPVLLIATAAGCDSILEVHPINTVEESDAISSPGGARAAVAGMYDALQSTSYYGGQMTFFGDLSAEDVQHTGTFSTYRQVDLNGLSADNTSIQGNWNAMYRVVGRANIIIARVPSVTGLAPAERDEMLAAAYFIRGLSFHNLQKFWGELAPTGLGIPLPIQPNTPTQAAQIARSTTAETYTQILSDLAAAESLMTAAGGGGSDPRRITLGAIRAIRARVMLYQGNYAGAETEAQAVMAMGYILAPIYADLFDEDPGTGEEIFLLEFTPVDFQLLGFYYRAKGAAGGRREIGPTNTLIQQWAPGYTGTAASFVTSDLRGQHDISFQGTTVYGSKWPTGVGGEDAHVIRFAEVLLIKAEAEARQNKLAEADSAVDAIRVRAGLAPIDLVALGQTAAIAEILRQRRLELAFEGDRWPDLLRTGEIANVFPTMPAYQRLYPIPLSEIDIAANMVQNPGY